MQKTVETLVGDTPDVTFTFSVYRFDGGRDAPSAYIQAALHADELPGVVAVDALMPLLRKAEAEGRFLGKLTIAPHANPIGHGQFLFGDPQSRFHLRTRTNFNREFPLLETPDTSRLNSVSSALSVDQRLKARLLQLSVGHDIVLDLHCDDEGVPYLYVPKILWPAMSDVAAAMNMQAVVLWDGSSGSSFDEASISPYLNDSTVDLARRVVTTVEYRGVRDVRADLAEADALGIYRVLVARGVISDPSVKFEPYSGLAAPIENIEMVKTPVAGPVLFHVAPGDRVEAGALLATVVAAPGEPDGRVEIRAPQAGYILTHRVCRSLVAGDDVLKLVGVGPSAAHKDGALED
jgi:predicted deacylase